MKFVESGYDNEILSYDDNIKDDLAKAKRRELLIVATPEEAEKFEYNPNAARENNAPGIECCDMSEDL